MKEKRTWKAKSACWPNYSSDSYHKTPLSQCFQRTIVTININSSQGRQNSRCLHNNHLYSSDKYTMKLWLTFCRVAMCFQRWERRKIIRISCCNSDLMSLEGQRRLLYPAQVSSVSQSCPTLCNPMNRSTPGLPVHHQLPEFTQTHVHRVSDAIQPSHPWSSPSPCAPNPSQHQSLSQWVNSSSEVAKVLEFQL